MRLVATPANWQLDHDKAASPIWLRHQQWCRRRRIILKGHRQILDIEVAFSNAVSKDPQNAHSVYLHSLYSPNHRHGVILDAAGRGRGSTESFSTCRTRRVSATSKSSVREQV